MHRLESMGVARARRIIGTTDAGVAVFIVTRDSTCSSYLIPFVISEIFYNIGVLRIVRSKLSKLFLRTNLCTIENLSLRNIRQIYSYLIIIPVIRISRKRGSLYSPLCTLDFFSILVQRVKHRLISNASLFLLLRFKNSIWERERERDLIVNPYLNTSSILIVFNYLSRIIMIDPRPILS